MYRMKCSKMLRSPFLIILMLFAFGIKESSSLIGCDITSVDQNRKLTVATCDSRSGIKGFNALRAWNISGDTLHRKGLSMKNVCSGVDWGKFGFLTKPMRYYEYMQKTLRESNDVNNEYFLLMDSDTFWSSLDINHIWRNFDCARGNKTVVAATEMQCWIGRYCSASDVETYYNNSGVTSSYSMFLNSGVIIGQALKLSKMLHHIISNNQSYYITFKKHKFDDQFAFAHYALKIAPEDIALDYHQYISASFSTHTAMYPPSENHPFVCKSMKTTNISFSCMDSTMQVARKGGFALNSSTCLLKRELREMPLVPVISQLSPQPVLWHGNGAGKRTFWHYMGSVFDCFLHIRNITKEQFMSYAIYS
mmetsp:Transcript_24797/g.25018  ORF Transcript_24797/g.25018 Transcript_24797/m.25018 type:complete len:364 (+) Transcript_24797:55-1146(+)